MNNYMNVCRNILSLYELKIREKGRIGGTKKRGGRNKQNVHRVTLGKFLPLSFMFIFK